MNVERKLRRAFRNATPNVLGALPAREEEPKKVRRVSKKWLQALPTAASLVLIAGAVALAVPYFGSLSGPGASSQPPAVTTQSTQETYQEDAALKERITADALSIVEQTGETLIAEVAAVNMERYRYRVTVEREGIIYKLYYTADGQLETIKKERTETAAGLIPESVAYAMAWTDWGKKLEDYTIELKTAPEGFPYYEIRAVEPLSPWMFFRYVHAENGNVFLQDPQGIADEEMILQSALRIVGVDRENQTARITELNGEPHGYLVTVEREGILYRLYYARSCLLQKLELTRTADAQGYIPESVAFALAELDVGADCVLESVETEVLFEDEAYYHMKLKTRDGRLTAIYKVNACTGEVLRAYQHQD